MKLATNQVLPNLKDTLENWLLQYDIQLKQLKTVVACTHGPKSKLIESQYLISIYKRELGAIDDSEVLNNYLYITEVLPSQLSDSTILEQQLIKELLVPSQVNREIGEDMLNSPIGMFQDILHEDGAEWVERDEKEYRRQNAYCPISNE